MLFFTAYLQLILTLHHCLSHGYKRGILPPCLFHTQSTFQRKGRHESRPLIIKILKFDDCFHVEEIHVLPVREVVLNDIIAEYMAVIEVKAKGCTLVFVQVLEKE